MLGRARTCELMVIVWAAWALPACSSADASDSPRASPPQLTPAVQALRDQQLPAAELAVSASSQLEQLIAERNPDPVGTLEARLRADPRVTAVERLDDDTLIATLANGSSFSVFVDEKSRREWRVAGSQQLGPGKGTTSTGSEGSLGEATARLDGGIVCDPTTYPRSKKACIVPAFQGEFKQDLSGIGKSLTRAGFTAETLSLKSPKDLATLQKTLSTCGVLYLSSHGGRGKNLEKHFGNHITTEIEVGLPDQDKFAASLADLADAFGADLTRFIGVTAHGKKAYWTLSPEFFASVQYPNTLVYADACSSDKPIPAPVLAGGGMQLKDAFRKAGAGAFLGWQGPITTRVSNPAADGIFGGLAPKELGITAVTITVVPPNPGPGESYVPSASVAPPLSGIELRLTVSGTDGYALDVSRATDGAGKVTFDAVPGGSGGVVDTITVSAGEAKSSSSARSVVQSDPTLQEAYTVPWSPEKGSVSSLTLDASPDFNLVCNNQKLTQTQQVVKF
jgi:hypothetical protein